MVVIASARKPVATTDLGTIKPLAIRIAIEAQDRLKDHQQALLQNCVAI